jgi:phosphopantothenoylcysteine synthetase/decarboxylase
MNILVTAGNTQVRIDKVRCLTNIFTGRTGASIAVAAHQRGHRVTLFTSHPEAVTETTGEASPRDERWGLVHYRTFEELQQLMQSSIPFEPFDAVIHSAAVSDYLAGGTYAPAPGMRFEPENLRWVSTAPRLAMLDCQAEKIKSHEPELWLRLVRAPKLIDLVRAEWGFRGVLVKFKLEVGRSDNELLEIAERSRKQSGADLMVANTLEGAATFAYLGPVDWGYQYVSRSELAPRLLEAVEQMHEERRHG